MLRTETASCVLCSDILTHPVASGWDFEYLTTLAEHHLLQCMRCGTIILSDRPTLEEMSTIYPPNYYSFSETKPKSNVTGFFRNITELAKVKDFRKHLGKGEKNIIDIGCGDGRLLDILKKYNASWKFAGIEIDDRAVILANRKGYSVIHGNYETDCIPWQEGIFDLALMHQVIEHTRNPREVLRRTNHILKTGGFISIETPDMDSLDFKIFKNRYWGGYHIPRHFYLFNKKSIAKLLRDEGFEVISISSILSPVFWIHSVHNWLIDRKWGREASKFFNYQNALFLACATSIELIQTKLFGKNSNMRVIARKQ